MSKYQVLKDFTDLKDANHVYREGQTYPRKGTGKKERIKELLSPDNRRGVPLIQELEE